MCHRLQPNYRWACSSPCVCHKHTSLPVVAYCSCRCCCMPKQTSHAKCSRHVPSVHLFVGQLCMAPNLFMKVQDYSQAKSLQPPVSGTRLLICCSLADFYRWSMSPTHPHMGILQVVYEDGHMACVVKPAGMPTAQVNIICRSYHNLTGIPQFCNNTTILQEYHNFAGVP